MLNLRASRSPAVHPAGSANEECIDAGAGRRRRCGRARGRSRGGAPGPRRDRRREDQGHRQRRVIPQQRSDPRRHVLPDRIAAGLSLPARPPADVCVLRLPRRAASQMRQADRRHRGRRGGQDGGDPQAGRDQRRRRLEDDRRRRGARHGAGISTRSPRCIRRRPASSTAIRSCARCRAISRIAAARSPSTPRSSG